MDLSEEQVDKIEEVRQIVESLIEMAEESDSELLDEDNLRILEAQLDALHQGLSMAFLQKEGLDNE